MIKVNELRIGNFIVDDDGALSKVISLKPYDHSVRCDGEEGCDLLIDIYGADSKIRRGYAVESNIVNPIPLTPEWLERCGYKQDSIDKRYYNSSTYLGPLGLVYKGEYCMIGLPLSARNVKYVHQLQNLIFALTGKELETTPPSP